MEPEDADLPADLPDLSSDEDDFKEDEWKEMETEETSDQCLFCAEVFSDVNSALVHCKSAHNFDLSILKVKHNMDFYSYVKLIGYVRSNGTDAVAIMTAIRPLWDDEKYLKPVRQENWLMYDFDSLNEGLAQSSSFHANLENGLVTLSEAHFVELQKTMQSLTGKLREKEEQLKIAAVNIDRMKLTMHKVIEDDHSQSDKKTCVGMMDLEDDSGYFNTYAHFSIHHEMLSDKVRTDSYRLAILNNKTLFQDKTVLDLGCGTGILSMFCSTAGAARVFAVDQSDIIYHAMVIVKENDLNDKISIIKGRLEDIELPEKVDVVVSEWMGYFLLFEGMLDSVIFARNNCLKPGGVMLPNRCNISIVGSGDVETHNKFIGFWSDVYGFKMNCMKSEVIREASVEVADPAHVITTSNVICEIDMYKCDVDSVNFSSQFNLQVLKDGFLTFLVGYFDTFFELPDSVSFSTGPLSPPTHWKQTIFYLKDPIPVKKGDNISGKLTCNRNVSDIRGLIVHINILNKTYKYILN